MAQLNNKHRKGLGLGLGYFKSEGCEFEYWGRILDGHFYINLLLSFSCVS